MSITFLKSMLGIVDEGFINNKAEQKIFSILLDIYFFLAYSSFHGGHSYEQQKRKIIETRPGWRV